MTYEYNGEGRSNLVPTRDITDAEFEKMNGSQRRIILHSGWYNQTEPGDQTREQLNEQALAMGIENPGRFKTKAKLIAAMEEATNAD